MNCPNCNTPLRPNATFCGNCGQKIGPGAAPAVPPQPAAPIAPTAVIPPVSPIPAGPPPPALHPLPQPVIPQLGATGTSTSIWGPFAGYGTRRQHTAWLLEGLGIRAEELRNQIADLFNCRQIPNARIAQITLTGQGVAVEQRPFYRVQRGLATVFLYVARFGEDLYISQVSYIKGPISLLRVLVGVALLALVGMWLVNIIALMANLSDVASAGPFGRAEPNGALVSALCCTGLFGPLALLALVAGLAFSVYKFLTEKDLLALLRSPLTEFQEDDIVSMEKAVNETVRKSADLIGIDLKLLAPGEAYRSGRRLI
jgi:hypothetical protein